jgi:hypothetical protein
MTATMKVRTKDSLNRRSAVPRHPEIRDELVRKIGRDLGIDPPDHT